LDLSGIKEHALEKLHIEELHNLCFSLSIIGMIKSRRMKWTEYVARIGQSFGRKPGGKRALVRSGPRQRDNTLHPQPYSVLKSEHTLFMYLTKLMNKAKLNNSM
jgi:hypothetical protein